jgi:uncharacterized membrane protein (DUF4010 family)
MGLVINFAIALFIGALLGLEREHHQQSTKVIRFAGIRTFTLISLFGAILGYLSKEVLQSYAFAVVGFVIIGVLSLVSYIVGYLKYSDTTATTEVAAIFCYILGMLTMVGYVNVAIMLGIVVAALLTFKAKIHGTVSNIKTNELFAIVEFAILALVILPLLPDKNYSPLDVPVLRDVLSFFISENILAQLDVFNLYNMWLMVILVAGISLLGYILVKYLGTNKGYGITGLVGGLVSSTAVTLSMSHESKIHKNVVSPFVVAVVLASATAFIRVMAEVAVVNNNLLRMVIIPLGIMGILGYLTAFIIYLRRDRHEAKPKEIKFKQPFSTSSAFKFGLFFVLIVFVAKVAQIIAGSTGIYFAALLSGLADVDAITLTMSSLSAAGQVAEKVAVTAIILAVSMNTLVKSGIAWTLGERKFARNIFFVFIFLLLIGLGSLFFI